jgi:hypothetical protein
LDFFLHDFSVSLHKDKLKGVPTMTIPQSILLKEVQARQLLDKATELSLTLNYLPEKHQVILEKGQEWIGKLYLPWTWIWTLDLGLNQSHDSHFSLLLIRAGQAAVGYFHQGKLIDHRVFRAYMVRQKQGSSQIKYLKTKGKSRAGSRIRLAETERFFEEINERLTYYAESYPIDFWGISCGKTLWPFLFDSEVIPPFSSKSHNLIELPVHIPQASFENLEKTGKILNQFHLILSPKGKEILGLQEEEEKGNDLEEDW